MTPAEFEVYVKAFEKQRKREIERTDYLNYILGRYITFSVNDPKNYPKEPFCEGSRAPQTREMSDDEMATFARGFYARYKKGK